MSPPERQRETTPSQRETETAYRAARDDQLDREERLSKHGHAEWLAEFERRHPAAGTRLGTRWITYGST